MAPAGGTGEPSIVENPGSGQTGVGEWRKVA
jgi:hypothetical protein